MNVRSSIIERYAFREDLRNVFTVASVFIQTATPVEQKRLLDLVIDTGNTDVDDRLFRNALDEYQFRQDSLD